MFHPWQPFFLYCFCYSCNKLWPSFVGIPFFKPVMVRMLIFTKLRLKNRRIYINFQTCSCRFLNPKILFIPSTTRNKSNKQLCNYFLPYFSFQNISNSSYKMVMFTVYISLFKKIIQLFVYDEERYMYN